MGVEIDAPRTIARVKWVSSDRSFAYLEYRNGQVGTCASGRPMDLSSGDVVFLNSDNDGVEKAPSELWEEETWVGVIRLLLTKKVVIDVGARLRILPRPEHLKLREGNTVQGSDVAGISEILSEEPVRYIDLPAVDELTIGQFKSSPRNRPSFDDFGGHSEIVKRARELVELPLKHHDALAAIGARPIKGVLFTGEPGTGKTLLARIIANNAGAQFYQISGPQVLNKWVGQSEELIRKIFEDAADQARSIVVIDEIDSLATQRSDESHEVSRRIVGQLLTSMDGLKKDTNTVVIATTNRPQDIDKALRRPGRFDWEIHFPLPTREDREVILSKTAPLGVDENLPHAWIAERTASWRPVDLEAIWSEAALLAVSDGGRKMIYAEDYIGGFERVAAQRARVMNSQPYRNKENDW